MNITNILLCGCGGQGLVLTTKILSEAAFEDGYDLKTSDVIGLSQRGGMVWGSVRFGEKVHSALIPEGEVDVLLALEQLEALRWSYNLKPNATVLLNKLSIFPNRVLIEKEEYPKNITELLADKKLQVILISAQELADSLGNSKVMNLVMLGRLSTILPLSIDAWERSIEKNVPSKTIELNKKAFYLGREA
ncbi:indolepyruvate oxidoreductase subunit beta [Clostridium swellfunianum]|uniref:indolepyruvate oxidoreductase subunit beta n=1 Tax=Clostridium swellfunianum TaxID=1367462 RepID=UPI00202E9805|nr:indolepyruvate oxidoreductase subunit beta [Clostridium swellfunianum]MCM0647138.1 indolepyruvate oxidoreductase subunit beta [Clostridium swellfunianum]